MVNSNGNYSFTFKSIPLSFLKANADVFKKTTTFFSVQDEPS